MVAADPARGRNPESRGPRPVRTRILEQAPGRGEFRLVRVGDDRYCLPGVVSRTGRHNFISSPVRVLVRRMICPVCMLKCSTT